MVTPNISNVNSTTEYIIYMIMGSYFKKAVCKSEIRLKQLMVSYGETKRDTQIKIEEKCISYIDNEIIGHVPEDIFNDMVEVHFRNNDTLKRQEVEFDGYDWKLFMWSDRGQFDFRFSRYE